MDGYPIHSACVDLDLKLLQSELHKGVDPNLRSRRHTTPLMLCFADRTQNSADSWPLVRTLVDFKASVNAVNQRTKKPVIYYYLDQEPDIVEFLLDQGANVTDTLLSEHEILSVVKPANLETLFRYGCTIHPTNCPESGLINNGAAFEMCRKLSKLHESEADMRYDISPP